jgi:hypothetical protein
MLLSERADHCLAALDDASQVIARRVFLRLIRFGEGGIDGHRPQPMSALRSGSDAEQLTRTLHHLAAPGLLTIASDETSGSLIVDLADATLITTWPTLQTWIRVHGPTEQLRRQLESDATEWSQRTSQGVGDVGLLDNAQLRELTAWLTPETQRAVGVSDIAESFIAASRAAARGRWWPWRTSPAAYLAVVLILALLATPIILLFIVVLTASVIHRLGH